jgi:hypothetical protein
MAPNSLLTIIELSDEYEHQSLYECNQCERTFGSLHALYDHCRKARVHLGKWCERCQRLFSSWAARDAHWKASSMHHLCRHCNLDYTTSEGCDTHMMEDHLQCLKCSRHGGFGLDDLTDHMEEAHHYCSECERFFENKNNLRQVSEC